MKKLFSLLTIVFIFMGFGMSVQAEETDYSEYNYYNVSYFNVQDWTENDNFEVDIQKTDLSCDFYIHNTCHMAIYCESAYITSDGYDYYNIGFLYKRDSSDDVYAYGYQHLTLISGVTKGATFCGIDTFGRVTGVIDFNYTKIRNYYNETGNYKTLYTDDLDNYNFYSDANIHSLDCEDDFGISSNLPIFSSMQDAYDYLMGNLSIKDADNYEDLVGIVYDLEVPQDLKVSYNDSIFEANAYSLKWKQNDENYKNWKTEIYVYADFEAYEGILGIQTGDKYIYEDEFIYGESIDTYKLKYTLDTGSDIYEYGCEELLDKIFNENLDLTACYEKEFHIYIRNYYFDGELKHYSNWVLVNIDYDFVSGDDSSSVIEIGGSIDDSPGASTPDEDIKGEVNNDSQYDGTVNGNVDSSSDDIFSWIKNGFGLLGDNGLLALLTDTFAYIPDFIWAILAAGLGIFVMIAGAKYLFG